MSTQHPDNVSVPWFAEHAELGGEDNETHQDLSSEVLRAAHIRGFLG